MAKSISAKKLSALLHPSLTSTTGLQLKDLPKEQSEIIDKELSGRLQEELDRVKDAVAASLPARKDEVLKLFEKIELPELKKAGDQSLSDIIHAGISKAAKKEFSEDELRQLEGAVALNTPSGDIGSLLHLDRPLDQNPILSGAILAAKTSALANLAGIKGEAVERLAQRNLPLERIDEASLDELVTDKLITGPQKNDLLMVSRLGLVSGGDAAMLSALKAKKVESPVDLVSWDREDWVKLIEENKIALPAGEESAATYAKNIAETVERSFPTDYFFSRTVKSNPDAELKTLAAVEPLLQANAQWLDDDHRLTDDDLKSVSTAQRDETRTGIKTVKELANMYRYLGVKDIVAGKDGINIKTGTIINRLSALDTFYVNNPDLDLRTGLFTLSRGNDNDGFSWQGISEADKPLVRRQLAAFQRAYIIADNTETSQKLLKGGFDSAQRIAAFSEDEFIERSGLGLEEGRRVYKKANDLAIGAAHYYIAIRDGVKGVYQHTNANNQQPLVNDLKQIDGFEQLFGNQDFCDCEHCRSILSPGAYFCDLMYFVQENVSKKIFTGANATHPLYLKSRRPDLWTLTLTCDHTSTEIPYLQVVNEVLQSYLQAELGVADIYEFLKTAALSVNQPFDLSLEELRLYLSHFDLDLYGVYKEMRMDRRPLHRERLKLSPAQLTIVTTKDAANVRKRFGNRPLNNFSVSDFIGYAGITRRQLDDLLKTTFIPDIAQVKVKLLKDPSDIQKYSEQMDNLTDDRLDYIHRYLRLWKKTSYTLREFDLLLNALKAKGWLPNLEDTNGGYESVLKLAQALIFQDRLALGVEELATLIHQLPEKEIVDNQKPFAARIFNLDRINDPTVLDKTPYVLAGLGITEAQLLALTPVLGINLAQPLTIAVLSDLFRHARIARGLNWPMEDLMNALTLVLNGQPVKSFDDLQKLVDFADWLKRTPLAISDLSFLITGAENTTDQYKHTTDSIAQKVLEIQTREAVQQETDPVARLALKQKLLRDHLLASFNLTSGQFDQFLASLVVNNFNAASTTALNAAFTNDKPNQPADFNALLDLLHKLERYNLLFTRHEFTPDNITFLIDHKDVFGIADLKALTLADMANISLYRELVKLNDTAVERVQDALVAFQAAGNFNGQEEALANLWQQPKSLIVSLLANIPLATPAIDAARLLWAALVLSDKLGIQGDSLEKLLGADYKVAAGVALGAFASKYPDEAVRKQKLEPYTDKLNMLKRDALCDYIISRSDKFKFKDLTDLYAFFLLDVEMSGCFRTSYLVAAITSLQLYVMRCLTNLEQSDTALNPAIPDIKVIPTWIPLDEWEWRKNYRVWEANRRVFLTPENYIDPTLRDTKTHLFKELEDELLSQKITKESAEMAYKKYIAGFAELTRMRYAGAYRHAVYDNYGYANLGATASQGIGMYYFVNMIYFPTETDDSCYYIFARTNVLPYQYFYRTYNHYKKTWGNWIKIEMGIEAKEVSSLIHQGRLYLFWTEVKSKELNNVSNGTASSNGYVFTGYLKYSYLTENGKWSAPQRLFVGQDNDTEQKIYGRGRDTTFWNADRWEKEKDAIVEAYQEKVFRKPYAYSQKGNTAAPIGIGFIWSNNKGSSNVTYRSAGVDYAIDVSLLTIRFSVPSRDFTVVNNDFSGAIANVGMTATIKAKIGFVDVTQGITGTIQMVPGACVFRTSVLGMPISFPVSFTKITTPPPIKERDFDLSLSRNMITDPAEQGLFGGNSLANYSDEYTAAYTENGDLVHYVENGLRFMSNDKISQNREGLGGLHIYKGNAYDYVSANTILTDELADILYAKGVEEFLSLETQEMTDNTGQQLDFRGAYGEYYWEIYFHIPFLIADHFNANQKFAEAKWWYERIFNPTSEETPAGTTPTDHNWQFREFRGLTPQKLKDMLTDVKAIEVYKKDPFDPHAIARLRISAYQKSIVMKYIDNLMDWGDYLFTQDTRESINEAEMLYRLALNILGKRPVRMGKCETADENQLTYEKLGPKIGSASEFLITLENVYVLQRSNYEVGVGLVKNSKSFDAATGHMMKEVNFERLGQMAAIQRVDDGFRNLPAQPPVVRGNTPRADALKAKSLLAQSYTDRMKANAGVRADNTQWNRAVANKDARKLVGDLKFKKNKRFPSYDLVKQASNAFCIPENTDLLAYWDRVEDRLFKIWNCMNIKGVRRSLSLFQPPIDPMMLVRLRAAGLSLEDIIGLVLNAGKIPNYRFVYLVEKAKQYAQTVQGFGAALLSALEKKDIEELLLLRTTHEKNILRLTKEIRKQQLKEAGYQEESMRHNLANVQNRVDYYQGLIDAGLIAWETAEQVAKWTAGGIRITEATIGFLTSVFGFLPQIGSPFAMKYGGQELKNGTGRLADATGTLAAIADNIAVLAGMEAGHQRREQEWKQQLTLAQREFNQVEQQVFAAEVRSDIAQKELDLHEKNMDQLDELNDFYKNKFSSLGLYNYLASGLNRVYRDAYNIAYDLAKLAERAYQFERYDDSYYIQSDNWEFDRAGLLAGDRLLQQLMTLEKKYIDNNVRIPEISQSFSLAMLDAAQLLQLRQTGACTVRIPELAFEIFYPGQYRRVIRSVRITMPCVTGPYTNISARLTLLKGEIEQVENDPLTELAIAKNTSITTSSANNDGGLFELNFHDERYLPFEGAGAISEWRLELPSVLRSFNYDTIADVILHLNYTALDGDRATAEAALGAALTGFASTTGLFRLFSLKYDFGDAFARLLAQPAQQASFTVDKLHFPYVLSQKTLTISETKVYLKPKKEATVTVPATLKVNGANVGWAAGEDIALPGASGDKNKIKGGTVALNGDPVKQWTLDAGQNGLNKNDLDDVLILVKYRI